MRSYVRVKILRIHGGREIRVDMEIDPRQVSTMMPPEMTAELGYGVAMIGNTELRIVSQYTELYTQWKQLEQTS